MALEEFFKSFTREYWEDQHRRATLASQSNDGGSQPLLEAAVKSYLSSRGLRVVRNEGRGNCQFIAFAAAVNGIRPHANVTKDSARERSVDWLRRNSNTVRDFVYAETFTGYLQRMKRDGEWGDHLTLNALCAEYKVKAKLHTFDSEGNFRILSRVGSVGSEVDLLFRGEIHYELLVADAPAFPHVEAEDSIREHFQVSRARNILQSVKSERTVVDAWMQQIYLGDSTWTEVNAPYDHEHRTLPWLMQEFYGIGEAELRDRVSERRSTCANVNHFYNDDRYPDPPGCTALLICFASLLGDIGRRLLILSELKEKMCLIEIDGSSCEFKVLAVDPKEYLLSGAGAFAGDVVLLHWSVSCFCRLVRFKNVPACDGDVRVRPYQREALFRIHSQLGGDGKVHRGVVSMPCGAGKTLVARLAAEMLSTKTRTVVVLVPSLALIAQVAKEWSSKKAVRSILCVCSDSGFEDSLKSLQKDTPSSKRLRTPLSTSSTTTTPAPMIVVSESVCTPPELPGSIPSAAVAPPSASLSSLSNPKRKRFSLPDLGNTKRRKSSACSSASSRSKSFVDLTSDSEDDDFLEERFSPGEGKLERSSSSSNSMVAEDSLDLTNGSDDASLSSPTDDDDDGSDAESSMANDDENSDRLNNDDEFIGNECDSDDLNESSCRDALPSSTWTTSVEEINTALREWISADRRQGAVEDRLQPIRLIMCTYQSSNRLGSVLKTLKEELNWQCDVAIFDEAHRSTSVGSVEKQKWSANYALDDGRFPVKKRLFFTATPRESMRIDRTNYGESIFSMSLSRCIALKACRDYRVYIPVLLTTDTEIDSGPDKRRRLNYDALERLQLQHPEVQKIFSFHSLVQKAKDFAEYGGSVSAKNSFYHVNGEMSGTERNKVMERFTEKGNSAVLTNARCLTEGVDVPAVDAVVFMDEKHSLVDIIQASGRAMRPRDDASLGYIVCPVHVPPSTSDRRESTRKSVPSVGVSNEDGVGLPLELVAALRPSMRMLRALQQTDERLRDGFGRMRRGCARAAIEDQSVAETAGCLFQKMIDLDFMDTADLTSEDAQSAAKIELRNRIALHAIRFCSSPWYELYEKLIEYRGRNGHCNVPAIWRENPQLGTWVCVQRRQNKRDEMLPERKKLLDEIEFRWEAGDPWTPMFDQLKEYRAQNGHCNVPARWKDNLQLSIWVSMQRMQKKKDELLPKRKKLLDEIGFQWEANDSWPPMFAQLKEYRAQNGNCDVPATWKENPHLGNWVSRQRKINNKDKMLPERKKLLDEIG